MRAADGREYQSSANLYGQFNRPETATLGPAVRTAPRQNFLSAYNRDVLLSGNKSLLPQIPQSPLGCNMLRVAHHSIVAPVPLDLINFGGDVQRCRPFARSLVLLELPAGIHALFDQAP